MKKILMLLIFVLLAVGIFAVSNEKSNKVYYYDKYATLTGVLELVTVEDEMEYESSKPVEIFILVLDDSVSIKEEIPVFGDGSPDLINELHVVEPFEGKVKTPLKTAVGKRVTIKGELVKAHTGYHKRDALLFDAVIQ